MEFDISTLTHSQFNAFATENNIKFSYLQSPTLRIAIHDAPVLNRLELSPRIAAMIVPEGRETDWIFCTESGHLQLLFHFNVSRLIIVGNNLNPNSAVYIRPPLINPLDKLSLEAKLKRYVLRFYPNVCLRYGLPQPLFLRYQDDVVYSLIFGRYVGHVVGEFLVEDVKLEGNQFRRRLRFKRTPNFIQSQVALIPQSANGESTLGLGFESLRNMEGVEFQIDTSVLVEPYMKAMVSALFLIASPLYDLIKEGIRPRALCLGVGGGSLLTFLHTQLELEVAGLEIDEDVLIVAREIFGLNDFPSIKLDVGDAIALIEQTANSSNVNKIDGLNSKFDVVMVDLDSLVAVRLTAPPLRFMYTSVIQAMKLRLHDHGVLVIRVIPPNDWLAALVQKLKEGFHKVYKIDAKNDRDFVLIATLTPVASNDHANALFEELRSLISGSYIDSIREL